MDKQEKKQKPYRTKKYRKKKHIPSLGELSISKYLTELKIKYEIEKTFDKCVHIKPLRFDFYLPDYNCCIEYDGEQHFQAIRKFGGKKGIKKTQFRDSLKVDFCIDQKITLIRIPYYKFDKFSDIIDISLQWLSKNSSYCFVCDNTKEKPIVIKIQ